MSTNKFFSTKVNFRKLYILLSFTIFAPLLILLIGTYLYLEIENSLYFHYAEEFNIFSKEEPLVLGTTDINNLDINDYGYYKDADIYTTESWEPEEYIEMERSIDNPKYDVKAGSITKDTFDIGNGDVLNLECEEIDKQALDTPPYWSSCTLDVNDYTIISSGIRSEINCDDYYYNDPNATPTGCRETVGIVLYTDPDLDNQYLFLSSDEVVGSPYSFSAYELRTDGLSPLYFDLKDSISEEMMTRGGMGKYNLYLAYTDESKRDFKLVTYFYDPTMRSILGTYHEFVVKNGRFLLDQKIVSL